MSWRESARLQGWRLGAVAVVLAYTLLGFLVLPWVARHQAPQLAQEHLGVDLAIEKLRFNPYLFRLTVEGLTLDDPASGPMLAFHHRAAEPPQGAEPFAVGVGRVEIANGAMDFTDLNLPIPFAALVKPMQGSISAITSGSPTPARVEIDGEVNEYGAATIRGSLDMFDPKRVLDLDAGQ